tara:strand:- start:4455 stop:4820 length:366 start_codon:yes stop_codon:yes gene_type:complete
MIKCNTCEKEVYFNDTNKTDNRCIGVIANNETYCIPCYEVMIFFGDDESTIPKKKKNINNLEKKGLVVKSKSITLYSCMKCNKKLDIKNATCVDCKWTHPMLKRSCKKKKKKKKKKRSKKI